MAYFPFVSHDAELNIILQGNIILSTEKSKKLKKVCTILMPEYLIPIYQKQEVALFICIKKGDSKLLHSVIVVKS